MQRSITQMKKHRSPNKWRGNRQTTWKRIQNDDSKGDKKNLEDKIQESINKDLEELKNKHTRQAKKLLKLKIL